MRGAVGLLSLAASLLLPAPVFADQGVAIDLGAVTVTEGLLPGGGYRLPTLGVSNPGDDRAVYRMTVSYVTGQQGREPPGDWFRFDPREFALEPGATRAVRARIDLPVGADPGTYEALLGAELVTEGAGGRVGAAAASRLSFTVEPASTLEAVWLWLKELLARNAPWTYLVPAALLSLLLGRQLRRRFRLTVARR